MYRFFALLVCFAPQAQALTCAGTNPNWTASLTGGTAKFRYLEREGSYTIPLTTPAINNAETIAYTLISDFDTAILLVHPGACNGFESQAHVMTQDRGEAILLSGCCTELAK